MAYEAGAVRRARPPGRPGARARARHGGEDVGRPLRGRVPDAPSGRLDRVGAGPGGDRARRPRASAPLAGLPRRRDRREGGRGPLSDARRAAAADHVRRLAGRRGRLRRLHEPSGRDRPRLLARRVEVRTGLLLAASPPRRPRSRARGAARGAGERRAAAPGVPVHREGRPDRVAPGQLHDRSRRGGPSPVQPGLRTRRDRPEARRAGPGAAPSAGAGAERAAAQARPG